MFYAFAALLCSGDSFLEFILIAEVLLVLVKMQNDYY